MNKIRVKVFALIICIVFSVGILSACQGPATTAPTTAPNNTTAPSSGSSEQPTDPTIGRQTLKIAIATCFTGPGARGAETQLYGLQVALDQIEASGYSEYYDFELIQADDQYDATQATNVANKLVYQDGVKAVFGHLNAVVTLAGLNVYEEAGVPCLTPSGSSSKITGSGFEYVLLVVPSDVIIAKTLVDYLVDDKGIEKIGVLYANNDQGQSGLAYVKEAMNGIGKTIADEQAYLVTDTDFTGQMLNFKSNGCEAVVVWGGEVSQRAVIVKQARQYIGTDVQIAGDANFSNATFVSLTEPAEREGIVFAAAWSNQLTDDASKQFVADFVELDPLKQTPGAVTVRFYDGMYLLATALNNMGPYDVEAEDFTAKLNKALHDATYNGLQGLLDPDEAGNCLNQSMIIRYDSAGNEELVSR